MLYLIIEHFHPGKVKELYKRFEEKGRLMPEGVEYINSWIDEHVRTCYQIIESYFREKIEEWVNLWNDLADFEIIPVITSAEAKDLVLTENTE
jgi:hypothetical protein